MKTVYLMLSLLSAGVCSGGTWETREMKNGLIELQIVPRIGGRVLQLKLGDYGFFFVNADLYGKQPPESGVGPDNTWLNYGGDKLWIAPQGWDSEEQWPGPPDPVLDGQPYTMENLGRKEIRLTSREDARSGIQLSRVITMYEGTTRVNIQAAMKNIDSKPRRWGIWAHTQLNAANRHGEGYNKNFWAYCPLNKKSLFPRRFDFQYGLVNNPCFMPDYVNDMMRVNYKRIVGKIGIDSSAGWVASVDATDGYVFVYRFNYEPDKAYPDNSSVEIWTNGVGEFVAWGKLVKVEDDLATNPHIFEVEILSPYANLQPGQECNFNYEWYSAKIRPGLPVLNCTDAGVICQPLQARTEGQSARITGRFGVFYEGTARLFAIDNNNRTKAIVPDMPVTPLKSFDLDVTCNISEVKDLYILIYDKDSNLIGTLATISPASVK